MERFKSRVKRYIKRVYRAFNKMEMRVLPGNVAYFFVLALIPIVTLITFFASYFSLSLDSLIDFIDNMLPGEISTILIDTISGKGFDSKVGTFNVIALALASNGTYAIISVSNILYKVKRSDFLRDRVRSIILLFILVDLILFLLLVPIFGGKILSLFRETHFIDEARLIYNLLKWPLTFFLLFFTLKLIYTIAPSTRIPSKSTSYGALFTTICWSIATAIFAYYLEYFADYNIIYGNISSIIILMVWMYIISYVFVLGIAINSVNLSDLEK